MATIAAPIKAVGTAGKAAAQQDEIGLQGIRYLMCGVAAGLFALFVYASHYGGFWKFVPVAGEGIVVAGAALMIGGVLGFLFGIPRTVASEHHNAIKAAAGVTGQAIVSQESRGAAELPPSYLPSTDLEQIADWLTKILVGVGLTELSSVPDKVNRLGNYLKEGLGGSATFAVGLSVYFVLCGFLIGFLWTRLYLPRALRWSDVAADFMTAFKEVQENSDLARVESRELKAEVQNTKAKQDVQDVDNDALDLVMRKLNPRPGLAEVTEEDLQEKIKIATPLNRAKIFHEARAVRSANWNANRPLMERTIPIFEALIKSDSDNQHPEYHGELGCALKDKGELELALRELDTAVSIHDKLKIPGEYAWYRFQRAVCRIYLDDNFKGKLRSDDKTKQQIADDLKVAWNSGLGEAMDREGQILKDWIKRNDLEAAEFAKNWVREPVAA